MVLFSHHLGGLSRIQRTNPNGFRASEQPAPATWQKAVLAPCLLCNSADSGICIWANPFCIWSSSEVIGELFRDMFFVCVHGVYMCYKALLVYLWILNLTCGPDFFGNRLPFETKLVFALRGQRLFLLTISSNWEEYHPAQSTTGFWRLVIFLELVFTLWPGTPWSDF